MKLFNINIAIVDDHELFSLGMKALITEFIPRENVMIMHDGQDFIDYVESGKSVDLLLVDLQMPIKSGKAVIRHLTGAKFQIKIIVISMHNENYVVEECKALGANGFIKKDSSTEILKEGISQVLLGELYFPSLYEPARHCELNEISKEFGLTKREIEIIKMIKNNYSSHHIADILHISYQTVKTHRKNINQKLYITNVIELIDFANKHNL
ncbi:MAG TPA: response regulator transcription factor [Anditalea sp.]|nr:response regulator transcription factor [Anditalea sp.]